MTEYIISKEKGGTLTFDGDMVEAVQTACCLVSGLYKKIKDENPIEAVFYRHAVTRLVESGEAFERGARIAEAPTGDLKALIDKALKGDKGNE